MAAPILVDLAAVPVLALAVVAVALVENPIELGLVAVVLVRLSCVQNQALAVKHINSKHIAFNTVKRIYL